MAAITYYVVQAYDLDEEGNLVAREPHIAQSAGSARQAAVILAGDPDIGEYSEPTIIHHAGHVPDELE